MKQVPCGTERSLQAQKPPSAQCTEPWGGRNLLCRVSTSLAQGRGTWEQGDSNGHSIRHLLPTQATYAEASHPGEGLHASL